MHRLLALLGATLALVSATPRLAGPDPAVAIIACDSGFGTRTRLGTAFWIAPHRLLTAAHVSSHGRCAIGGIPLEVVREDGVLDVAELHSPTPHPFLPFRCSGFRAGRLYRAIGFIAGRTHAELPWRATGRRDPSGQHEFLGQAEPGMSGGPVLDHSGRAVGVVDQRFPARSRALEETHLCPH